jgi:hypothetical protein
MTLFRPDGAGVREIFRLDTAWTIFNFKAPAGSGLISMLYNLASNTPVFNMVNAASQTTVYIDAAELGTQGARMELSQSGGTETIVFDADAKAEMGGPLGGEIQLNRDNGSTGVTLSGDPGVIHFTHSDGDTAATFGTSSTAGSYLYMYDTASTPRSGVRILGEDIFGSNDGGSIYLRDNNTTKLELLSNYAGTGFSRVISDVIEIKGGADLSEQFDVGSDGEDVEPGMVVSIDADNPGKLVVADRPYDYTVAGVVSGAGGVKPGMLMGQRGTVADGKHPIALTGRVWTWCDASGGAIKPGDLLTTSSVPGHAMKVTDRAKAQGAMIGKAMTSLPEGKGLVLVLVSLQ